MIIGLQLLTVGLQLSFTSIGSSGLARSKQLTLVLSNAIVQEVVDKIIGRVDALVDRLVSLRLETWVVSGELLHRCLFRLGVASTQISG